MATTFKPFADDADAPSVGTLTIENSPDRISIAGSLDIAKDQRGLKLARALYEMSGAIVATLEAEHDLPERAKKPRPAATATKPNPFV